MTSDKRPGYAARLNAFKPVIAGNSPPSRPDFIAAASPIEGIISADLDFPDHVEGLGPRRLVSLPADNGMASNGLAMR